MQGSEWPVLGGESAFTLPVAVGRIPEYQRRSGHLKTPSRTLKIMEEAYDSVTEGVKKK
jgi:hypothetical protein